MNFRFDYATLSLGYINNVMDIHNENECPNIAVVYRQFSRQCNSTQSPQRGPLKYMHASVPTLLVYDHESMM